MNTINSKEFGRIRHLLKVIESTAKIAHYCVGPHPFGIQFATSSFLLWRNWAPRILALALVDVPVLSVGVSLHSMLLSITYTVTIACDYRHG